VSSPFAVFANATLERWLAAHPVEATFLGDHTYDEQLGDPSPAAADARRRDVAQQLAELDRIVVDGDEQQVDAAVLRTALRAELLELEQLRAAEWDAMEHNPGNALYALVSRQFAPPAARLEAARARLAAVPAYLAAARERLGTLSRVHAQTAIQQLAGTVGLIDDALPALAAEADAELGSEAARARDAVEEHRAWLREQLDSAGKDPRIGPDNFTAKLALTLDTDYEPDALLGHAEDDLERISAEIATEAGRFADVGNPDASTVKAVLDELARDVATDETVLAACRDAMATATDFVRSRDLVTVYDDPIDIVEMPEIDRGIAGAYCNPSGPLEVEPLPTQFAVSPTPAGWSAERIASYYREYNLHMLHNLTVHEAMPGHALQLMHSNRHSADTPIRAVFGSGSFIEGWAVYAEELMATHGYRTEESTRAASALRMQQLKMQLRSTLNTILDIRFHCHGLTRDDALALMTERGFQEEGEATEKWQRVQLTSTQLCTYYVGYREVRDLARDLAAARAKLTLREVHNDILGHGSPPVRHLRTLLDV
jgi:uncharacterized protein (DUF885 family)